MWSTKEVPLQSTQLIGMESYSTTFEPHLQRMVLVRLFKIDIVHGEGGLDSSLGWQHLCLCNHDNVTPDKHYHMTINKHPRCLCASPSRWTTLALVENNHMLHGNT